MEAEDEITVAGPLVTGDIPWRCACGGTTRLAYCGGGDEVIHIAAMKERALRKEGHTILTSSVRTGDHETPTYGWILYRPRGDDPSCPRRIPWIPTTRTM